MITSVRCFIWLTLILRRAEYKAQELLRAFNLKARYRGLNEIGRKDTQSFTLSFKSSYFVSCGCKVRIPVTNLKAVYFWSSDQWLLKNVIDNCVYSATVLCSCCQALWNNLVIWLMTIIALCSLLIMQENMYLLHFSEINLLLWKCNEKKWLHSKEKLPRIKISIAQCSSY